MKKINKELQKKIFKMVGIEQRIRKSRGLDLKKMKQIDQKNTKEMKKIIKEYGWPVISLVGKRASAGAWLLVQHADRNLEFQKMCLNLIKKAAGGNNVSKWQIAYLTDRILMNQKKKQVYGTQIRFNKETGIVTPYPIKNPKKVNKLRMSFELEPLEKYIKKVTKINRKLFGEKKLPPRRR